MFVLPILLISIYSPHFCIVQAIQNKKLLELEQKTNAQLVAKIQVLELEAKARKIKERDNTSRMETLLTQTLNRVGELESAVKTGMDKPKQGRVNTGDGTPRTAAPSDDDDDEHADSSPSESEDQPNHIVTPNGQRVPLMPFEKAI